jgi:hypothetical protein
MRRDNTSFDILQGGQNDYKVFKLLFRNWTMNDKDYSDAEILFTFGATEFRDIFGDKEKCKKKQKKEKSK